MQAPGYVAIRYERIHDVRVIPLDGRPHAGALVRAHMGDAGANPARLRLTEEFTPQPDGKLTWSVTVDDSSTWTASWTFSMALTPDSGERILEYACHEGNRAMSNSLSAAHAEERAGTR